MTGRFVTTVGAQCLFIFVTGRDGKLKTRLTIQRPKSRHLESFSTVSVWSRKTSPEQTRQSCVVGISQAISYRQ